MSAEPRGCEYGLLGRLVKVLPEGVAECSLPLVEGCGQTAQLLATETEGQCGTACEECSLSLHLGSEELRKLAVHDCKNVGCLWPKVQPKNEPNKKKAKKRVRLLLFGTAALCIKCKFSDYSAGVISTQ